WVDFWKRRNDVSIDNIEAYLYQAVRYQTYKIFKQKKIIKVQIEVINNLSIDPQVELEHNYEHTKLLLKKQIDKLPNRCRQIFILSKYNGLTNDQIAEQEGISKRTIENQLSIAKGILEPFAKGRNR
ncbi:sigma-70 family RNA polymerase sigma factor, partial [Flavobacteriaceae bacterium]|nr:sigma-70 family RNA polymerase sigma factor [Flavobacteriaceae bacterium]